MYQLKPKDIARFWMKTKKSNGCWEWQGLLTHSGYGRFSLKGKTVRAHRISYYLRNSTISSKTLICHSCDNPKCVNPDHLWEGTTKQNTEDMINKKRIRSNKSKKRKKSSSKYFGVTFRKESNKWRARYMINYKNYLIGNFLTEKEAAIAYDNKIKEINKNIPIKHRFPLNFTKEY